jgi:hypothetical protein
MKTIEGRWGLLAEDWRRAFGQPISDEEREDLLVTHHHLKALGKQGLVVGKALAKAMLVSLAKCKFAPSPDKREQSLSWPALAFGLEDRGKATIEPGTLEKLCASVNLEKVWFHVVGHKIRHDELQDLLVFYCQPSSPEPITLAQLSVTITLLLAAKRNLVPLDASPKVQARLAEVESGLGGVQAQIIEIGRIFQIRLVDIGDKIRGVIRTALWAALILSIAAVCLVSFGYAAGRQTRIKEPADLAAKAFDAMSQQHPYGTLSESKEQFATEMHTVLLDAPVSTGWEFWWPAPGGLAIGFALVVAGAACVAIGAGLMACYRAITPRED